MSDAAAPVVKAAKKKVSKPKKPAAHPKYSEMIAKAIGSLKERSGTSRQGILKYILANFNVGKDEKAVNGHLKLALRAGVKKATLKQTKGTGASGRFRLGEVKKVAKKPKAKKPAAKKAKKPKAAKPKAKKVKKEKKKKTKAAKPKKPAAKKPKAKKPKSPKKAAAKPKKKPAAKAKAKKPKAKKAAAK